jgi:tetratricopeptide (TPR) repeat protein
VSPRAATSNESSSKPRPSAAKTWLFRAVLVAVFPTLLLLGLEAGLRLAGFGRPKGFLIPDDQPGFYRTNPDYVSLYMPGSFELRPLNYRVAARKPPNTVRIVVLGESAAEGIPAPAFGFVPQLRAQLRARYPGRRIEILNTGVVAINSHAVYQIARDLAKFSPDLFIVYLGNNEVVGPYGPGSVYLSQSPPLWLIRLSALVRSTRTGQLIRALLDRLNRRGPPPPEWGGMSMFAKQAVAGDDPRLETVYRNFAANLTGIVNVANGCGAKTLLCTVASNLKDCAPLLSLHRPGMTEADLAAWQRAFTRGRIKWRLDEPGAARADLQEALRLDPHYADTFFMLGSIEMEAGNVAVARKYFLEAAHWDALRFRPDPRINEIIRDVAARERGVHLVDAAVSFGSDPASTAPPAGRELLYEHVHLNWEGNFHLARMLAEGTVVTLFGDTSSRNRWLDSAACAAALAYTPHEEFFVLQKLAGIVQNPPFTNQLTYVEDAARLARDLTQARMRRATPDALRQANTAVQTAIACDPENPALAKIEAEIGDDLGDEAGALAASRRNQQLQPWNFALRADEAIKLARLDRFNEARALLDKTAAKCTPRELIAIAPAYVDYFTRTRQFAEGRRYFDGLVARYPSDTSLRLLRGRLAQAAGDPAAAEQEFRSVLTDDPGNQNALESLVELLNAAGRSADVEQVSLATADRQPRNLENNIRCALIFDARGNDDGVIRHLAAAEQSGPVTSAVELRLARKFYARQQLDETLLHLAEAKRISVLEGDPATTQSITELIGQLRPAWH